MFCFYIIIRLCAGVLSGLQSLLMLIIDRGFDFLCSSRVKQPLLSLIQLVQPPKGEGAGEEEEGGGVDTRISPQPAPNALDSSSTRVNAGMGVGTGGTRVLNPLNNRMAP
jgi:hypothetical protein